MDEENMFENLSNAFKQCEDNKKTLRKRMQELIDTKKLFVAPVQDHNRSQHRAEVYNVIHLVYTDSELDKALHNCFVCSQCARIFFHLKTNGSAPFKTHQCFKMFKKKIEVAEKTANDAREMAKKAEAEVIAAKKGINTLQKEQDSSDESDDDDNDSIENPILSGKHTNHHKEVVAETIQSFVEMALNGKVVEAIDIVDHIPSNFDRFKWQQFVKKIEKKTFSSREQPE